MATKLTTQILTLLLKLLFIVIYMSGVFFISLLFTYANPHFYETEVVDNMMAVQARHAEAYLLKNKPEYENYIQKGDIEEALSTDEINSYIASGVKEAFTEISNYEGGTLEISLAFLNNVQSEFANNISEIIADNLSIENEGEKSEIKGALKNQTSLKIPSEIVIEVEESSTEKTLKTTSFIVRNRVALIIGIIIAILLPLVGISLLNLHPTYASLRKTSYPMIAAGGAIVAANFIFHYLVTVLTQVHTSSIGISGMDFTLADLKELIEILTKDMLNITTVIGVITLLIGCIFFAVSIALKKNSQHA